jgi:hypothetical protein
MIRTAERTAERTALATRTTPADATTPAPARTPMPKTMVRRWFKVEGQMECRWVQA